MKILLTLILFISLCFSQELPWEKSLIKGKLENGFEYTIKKNAKPAKKAELRLMVKAGSLEEDDDQRGIAHLVEHMAFNGTKHFKGNDIIKFLESIGVEFGSHLNASTSMDQTQYQLSIPLENDNIEKAFLIFKDWAGDVVFDEKELEKERGVVLEEARSRDNASFRISEQAKDTFYANSKYKDRTPIGDLEIIKNIKVDRVKDFYDDWYRPELMHFVAVGDFDVKEVEKLIKTTFSSLKNKSHRKKASKTIPKVDKTRFLFTHDKELTSSSLALYYFHDYEKITTIKQYKEELLKALSLKLFNQSNSSILTKDNPIAKSITGMSYKMGDNLKPYIFAASYQGMLELPVLNELVDSIYTIEKFGFDKYEFKALKKDMLSSNEEAHKTQEDIASNIWASTISSKALYNDVVIDEDFQYEFLKDFISQLSIEDLHKAFKDILKTDSKLVNYDFATQIKVSKRAIKKTIKKASQNVKKPIIDPNLPERILDEKLSKKAIKKEKYNKEFDFWELTLANEIKILYKKNDYKKNNVELYSYSKGGYSLIKDEDLLNAKFSANIIANSGIGKYSYKQLNRIYAGKRVKLRPYISRYSEGFSGNSSRKDFETLLEMLYLYHTQFTVNKNILKNSKSISEYRLREAIRDPKNRFSIEFQKFYYENNKRFIQEEVDDIKKVSKEKILKIYEDRFKDTNNFTYIIVGDIDYKKVKELSSIYLANLPSKKRKETFKDRNIKPIKGTHNFIKNYENRNISSVMFLYSLEDKYSKEKAIKLSALKDTLRIKLRELIREEKSGVYGVSVGASFSRVPYELANIQIAFTCDSKRKDELSSYVKQVIKDLQENEVEKKYLEAFSKKKVNTLEEIKKSPSFWMNELKEYEYFKDKLEEINNYSSYYKNITSKDIKETANKYFSTKNIIYSQLNPKI